MALEVFWDEVLKSPRQDLAEVPIGDLVRLPGKLVTPETSLARALAYLLAEETPMLPVWKRAARWWPWCVWWTSSR
jgi:hypothetical protein